jgi:serine/threonine protein kinase/tetratricopeptide (TPR) repeat protein
LHEEDAPDSGLVIDRFRVVRRLGAGGMGVVFEAEDRERGARVALKSLRTLGPEAVLRFKTEFRAISDVRHPNLVTLGELFEEGGQWFFTMEMVEGVHFLAYVRPGEYRRGKRIAPPPPAPSDAPTLEMRRPPEARPSSAATPSSPAPTRPTPYVPGFDEERLRGAMRQLALGLEALHAAAKVHCDIKPSNVLVTREGRVVVLDFGLVADLARPEGPADHLAGTVSYMAPEQAALRPVGAPADWYSAGVVLYQALTGRLPIQGAPLELLALKQVTEPRPPSELAPNVPPDLDRLCVELLRIDPDARPTGAEILQRLDASAPAPSLPSLPPRAHAFVGRRGELSALHRAYADARAGRRVAVFVHGESGVGKTALTRRFTEQLAHDEPDAVVLAGRCHERESVPYKAVDGIIDALSRHLKTGDAAEARAIAPTERGLLGQVFPVMRRVDAVAREPRPLPAQLDPQALRRRAFHALRALLDKIAERRPLVLLVDDLQWADGDSLALLAEVVREPSAPALLLLGTVRAASQADPAFFGALQLGSSIGGEVRYVTLEPLPADEARELATTLLRSAGAEGIRPEAIASEAGGHPLFIDELVRRAVATGGAVGSPRLDDALWARVEALEPAERDMMRLVAVAGAPIGKDVVAAAAGLDGHAFEQRIASLRSGNLARTLGARRTDGVECFHDRVRESVLARLAEPERRALHRRLANALEASEAPDPEALCEHFRGAGDPGRAAAEAERAAARAGEALAFDRAARLYELSLSLKPRTGAEAARLTTRLAAALASAGRGREAADAYLRGAAGSEASDALDLRRRAADQFLRSGHIDEAMEAFGAVLAAIDMDMPKTRKSALTSLVLRRAQVRLRGLRFKRREAGQIPPADLLRIDTCWSVAAGLALVDTVRGAYFQSRGLLLALDAGEVARVSRALAIEAGYSSASGGHTHDRTASLVARATELADQAGDPYTRAWAIGASGVTATLEGRWDTAHASCERAEAIFGEQCTGVAWEIASMRWFSLWGQSYLGRMAELSERVPERLREAEERGDLYAAMCHSSGLANLVWLAADEPGEARRRLDSVMRRWSVRTFHVEHWWEMLAVGQIDLYEGDGAGALRRIEERWPALDESMLLRVQLTLLEALHLRARASLTASLARCVDESALVASAERDAAAMEREKMPWSEPLVSLLRAGIAARRGDRGAAVAALRGAVAGLDGAHMALYAAAARARLGELVGGAEGDALRESADTWMAVHGVLQSRAMVAMLAPGFPG